MRHSITLNKWTFSIDAPNYQKEITVPHTWNVDDEVMNYRGTAKYQTTLMIDEALSENIVYITFNGVYHSADVLINGTLVGSHKGSGYTPFEFNVTETLCFGAENTIEVIADNTHIAENLPHGDDFDWADDGGIIRKVQLRFLPKDGISFLHATAKIHEITENICSGNLVIQTAFEAGTPKAGNLSVYDYSDGKKVLGKEFDSIEDSIILPFEDLKLWSPSSPNLYRVELETDNDRYEIRTGLRKIETRGTSIYLNNQEIYLKGCEWMPGSHPDFGMAEPLEHSIRCLRQLKDSGCNFTRFHWQQDASLFDWCDENGLLVQEEIPYWGCPKEATDLQLSIAKRQADEMVYFHKNHPSIVFWGVGNELGATTPSTIDYVEKMVAHFKALDSGRLVNYVSNTVSLVQNTQADDATLHGDIAMWNEYLGLWEPTDDIKAHIIRTAAKCADMPLVITEFGLCEPHFEGGDARRCEILKERMKIYPEISNLKGYVWFSLNDYRTHMGEEGEGKMKQRVHGSTDLYGNEKPSYQLFKKLNQTL